MKRIISLSLLFGLVGAQMPVLAIQSEIVGFVQDRFTQKVAVQGFKALAGDLKDLGAASVDVLKAAPDFAENAMVESIKYGVVTPINYALNAIRYMFANRPALVAALSWATMAKAIHNINQLDKQPQSMKDQKSIDRNIAVAALAGLASLGFSVAAFDKYIPKPK